MYCLAEHTLKKAKNTFKTSFCVKTEDLLFSSPLSLEITLHSSFKLRSQVSVNGSFPRTLYLFQL